MTKKALITGITGQDGSYLAELLLDKGYEVYGIIRRTSTFTTNRIDHIYQDRHEVKARLKLIYGDLSDASSITKILSDIKPDEVYNLAAQSHVRVSFDIPEYTGDVTGLGALRILEAIRMLGLNTRFYQASSSEMFGLVQAVPQKEDTPFYPRSPYAAAKLYAHWITKNYRESYGIFACSGILFNHESPRRGETFVTRKITQAVAHIKAGLQEKLYLGNLDSKRDWGYAKEYVEGMHAMLQAEKPDAFVLATGETYTIRQFVEWAFEVIGRSIMWEGQGVDEIGRDKDTGEMIVKINPAFYRPAEIDLLIGDPTKAKEKLGWEPRTKAKELAKLMVENDMKLKDDKNYAYLFRQ